MILDVGTLSEEKLSASQSCGKRARRRPAPPRLCCRSRAFPKPARCHRPRYRRAEPPREPPEPGFQHRHSPASPTARCPRRCQTAIVPRPDIRPPPQSQRPARTASPQLDCPARHRRFRPARPLETLPGTNDGPRSRSAPSHWKDRLPTPALPRRRKCESPFRSRAPARAGESGTARCRPSDRCFRGLPGALLRIVARCPRVAAQSLRPGA